MIEFENTDDDYKREAARVYDACTSAGERFWDIGTKIGKLVNDINDGIDAAVYNFVSGILGLAFTLAKIDVALRVAVVTASLGITPQWVKDTGKEAVEGLEGIAAILRNPGRALASLGQQVTDTVEEKGIPYALSYVTADIAIGILVDKGIGKIRGMNKADDLAKLSTKVDDVVDVADDFGAGVKAVEKADDVASIGGMDAVTSLRLPQGISADTFSDASKLIRESIGDISDDIVIQGSRASGTAKIASDIDIAVRVSPEKFDELIHECFGKPNPGTAKERTMLHAMETGKIQAGEAGLRGLRKKLENIFGIEVDISIIKIDDLFDNPPFISIE